MAAETGVKHVKKGHVSAWLGCHRGAEIDFMWLLGLRQIILNFHHKIKTKTLINILFPLNSVEPMRKKYTQAIYLHQQPFSRFKKALFYKSLCSGQTSRLKK